MSMSRSMTIGTVVLDAGVRAAIAASKTEIGAVATAALAEVSAVTLARAEAGERIHRSTAAQLEAVFGGGGNKVQRTERDLLEELSNKLDTLVAAFDAYLAKAA